ncbi:MAG: flippase-like domain-containing protein, partial [Dehalococcoidia bacterium]
MLRLVLGITFTAISTVILAFAVDWDRVITVLKGANTGLIALAVACLLASLGAKAARWRLLLPMAPAATTPKLFRILNISYFINNVLPFRVGDVARVAIASRLPGIRVMHVVSSLLTERVADCAVLLLGFLAVSPFLPLPASYRPWLHIAW